MILLILRIGVRFGGDAMETAALGESNVQVVHRADLVIYHDLFGAINKVEARSANEIIQMLQMKR